MSVKPGRHHSQASLPCKAEIDGSNSRRWRKAATPYRAVIRRLLLLGAVFLAAVPPALGAPTRSSPIAVAAAGASGDVVFVVNPDSSTVARLEFDAMHAGARTHEQAVGA